MGGEKEMQILGRSSLPKLSAGPVGQQVSSIYKERLGQFAGHGQYESQNLQACVPHTPYDLCDSRKKSRVQNH